MAFCTTFDRSPLELRHCCDHLRRENPLHWLELFDLSRLLAVHGVLEVPVLLQTEPEVGRHSEDTRQPKRRIRSDRTLAANDLIEPPEGDSQANRERGLADSEGLQELFEQHLSGMGRRKITRQPAL